MASIGKPDWKPTMGKLNVELEDRDFAFVIKMNRQTDAMGNVTGYTPVMKVFVGDKQIGLITNLEVRAATSGVTPDIHITLAGGLSQEDARRMGDQIRESVKDYVRLLGLVPGVKVESPFT